MKNLVVRPARKWAVPLVLASLTFAAFAHASLATLGAGDVEFLAVGPAGLKIEGKGGGLTASESNGVLTVVAPLTGLKTGISLRDEHLQKALKTSAHKEATLEVKRDSLKFPEDKKSGESSGSGDLTLNGVKVATPFKYKVERTGSDYHVQGATTIDITKFKMEVPCYLGVCVDKEVKVKVKFKLRDK